MTRAALLGVLAVVVLPAQTVREAVDIFNTQGYRAALPAFEAALAAARAARDELTVAVALNGIGNCYRNLAEPRKALQFFRESLEIKERLKDNDQIARTLSGVGLALRDLADYAGAVRQLERALSLAKQVHNTAVETSVENNLC